MNKDSASALHLFSLHYNTTLLLTLHFTKQFKLLFILGWLEYKLSKIFLSLEQI